MNFRALNLLMAVLIVGFLPIQGGCENASAAGAMDITARLFSTATISHLRVTSRNASWRTCVHCPTRPIPAPMEVDWTGTNPGVLRVSGQALPLMLLDGPVDMQASDGQRAQVAGHWRVGATKDGLHVTVTVPSERYVTGVLAAEAGQGTPAEALKALAVVARSFALTGAARHGAEGLCDSTHCQALRFAPVPADIASAVQATAGETLWSGGKRVPGYFSQNCGGMTEGSAEAWSGPRQAWLVSHPDPYCQHAPSQWHAELQESDVRAALAREGWNVSTPIETIEQVARDASGRAHLIRMHSSQQTVTLSASSFRFALNRSLGWNQLRSDRYTVHRRGAKLVFDGVGFGHGVGLCQAGAKQMAAEGRSYRNVLAFYFPGTTVRIAAQDGGWRSQQTAHVSVRDLQQDVALSRQAEQAFAEAKQQWRGRSDVRLQLTLYPTTELFRQSTGEPGWVLASTRGAEISLQPQNVLKQNGSVADVLRHELLHAMVEADAAAAAPLWLREGLVEVLNGEHCTSAASLSLSEIERELRNASTKLDSQLAHTAACARVRSSLQAHGLEAVQGWLRGGVPANAVPGK